MMNLKLFTIEVTAILVSYLLIMLPITSATQINIIFGGQRTSITLDTTGFVNRNIKIIHDPSDITWTKVRVSLSIDSASMAHSIEKIYVYKCRGSSPTECLKTTPQTFDNWVDTEFLWNDISEKATASTYPQMANIITFVKLKDIDGRISWLAFHDRISRKSYNNFDIKTLSLIHI